MLAVVITAAITAVIIALAAAFWRACICMVRLEAELSAELADERRAGIAETKRADDAETELYRLRTAPSEAARAATVAEKKAVRAILDTMRERLLSCSEVSECYHVAAEALKKIEGRS